MNIKRNQCSTIIQSLSSALYFEKNFFTCTCYIFTKVHLIFNNNKFSMVIMYWDHKTKRNRHMFTFSYHFKFFLDSNSKLFNTFLSFRINNDHFKINRRKKQKPFIKYIIQIVIISPFPWPPFLFPLVDPFPNLQSFLLSYVHFPHFASICHHGSDHYPFLFFSIISFISSLD